MNKTIKAGSLYINLSNVIYLVLEDPAPGDGDYARALSVDVDEEYIQIKPWSWRSVNGRPPFTGEILQS